MKIFVVDTETTGFEPNKETLIEVAGVVYDTTTETILESYQTLLYATSNAAQHVNNIKPEALKLMSQDQKINAKELMEAMAEDCDAVIAHNAKFDKDFLEHNQIDLGKPWVCSWNDITYPNASKSKKLGHLCYDHGVPVLTAHSALHDVYILIELFKKVPDLDKQLKKAGEPKDTYVAQVGFENKDAAKEKGFRWNPAKKLWTKEVRQSEAEELIKGAGFKIQKLEK